MSRDKNSRVSVQPLTAEAIKQLTPQQRADMALAEMWVVMKKFNCAPIPYRDEVAEKAEKSKRSLPFKIYFGILSVFIPEFRQSPVLKINISPLAYPDEGAEKKQ